LGTNLPEFWFPDPDSAINFLLQIVVDNPNQMPALQDDEFSDDDDIPVPTPTQVQPTTL
jgi:hypothetical protein